jgi:hypothetical protein
VIKFLDSFNDFFFMKQDMMMIKPTELSEASSSSDVLGVVLAAICCLFLFINVLRILTGCTSLQTLARSAFIELSKV